MIYSLVIESFGGTAGFAASTTTWCAPEEPRTIAA
jgi:hypothetical protein